MTRIGNRVMAQNADGGALPTLYAAVAEIPGNSFAGPAFELRGAPKLAARSSAARNPETARRLWTLSEDLTGAKFPL
jgi:hypothetical protein